ncbi:hypothetical protein Dimus_014758 [Dionaea muscipula]
MRANLNSATAVTRNFFLGADDAAGFDSFGTQNLKSSCFSSRGTAEEEEEHDEVSKVTNSSSLSSSSTLFLQFKYLLEDEKEDS